MSGGRVDELVRAAALERDPGRWVGLCAELEGVVKAEVGSLYAFVRTDGSPVARWSPRPPGQVEGVTPARRFRVTSGAGVDFGVFDADSAEQVLEPLAHAAGNASAADAEAVAGPSVIVSPVDVAHGFKLGVRGVNALVVEEIDEGDEGEGEPLEQSRGQGPGFRPGLRVRYRHPSWGDVEGTVLHTHGADVLCQDTSSNGARERWPASEVEVIGEVKPSQGQQQEVKS